MPISHLLLYLKAAARGKLPRATTMLHAQMIKEGFKETQILTNALLDAYGKCGSLSDARSVFEEMPVRDRFSWATVFTSCNFAGQPEKTLLLLREMIERDGLQPDHFVYATLFKACTGLCAARQGKQVHGRFLLSPFHCDDVVKSSMVDMYSKCGFPELARFVFDSMTIKSNSSWTSMIFGYSINGLKAEALWLFEKNPCRNLYSWTALISGLVQSGNVKEGISTFVQMRREGVEIVDSLAFSSCLCACSALAALELGQQIHGLAMCLGLASCLFIANSLIDMYSKSGDFPAAKCVFDSITGRNVVSWTAMIVGAAHHGKVEEALKFYDEMVLSGIKPNAVTFTGLINSCSHAGLVSKGQELFRDMAKDCGIAPSLKHFTCLLDLLSRSGNLLEAVNVIDNLPFEPDEAIWAALLSACLQHSKQMIALRVADKVMSLNPVEPSTLWLLSNIYTRYGIWERVSTVKKLLSASDFQREPGLSSAN